MRVDKISTNCFSGKVFFDKKLSKPMMEYANKVLDFSCENGTLRERIAKGSYDLSVRTINAQNKEHSKIYFARLLESSENIYSCVSHLADIDLPVKDGAGMLIKFLDSFENSSTALNAKPYTFTEKVGNYIKKTFCL